MSARKSGMSIDESQFKLNQRVRIVDNSGISYGKLSLVSGETHDMQSADGLTGVLVRFDQIDDIFGGSRWRFKADNGIEFSVCDNHLSPIK